MSRPDWIAGTVDESFKKYVTIDGVGRVGSYAAAKQGGYSRSRKHWVVCFYDGTRSETGMLRQDATELGTFKTGTLAAEAAEKFAVEKGWTLGDYPKSFLARLRGAAETMTDWLKPAEGK